MRSKRVRGNEYLLSFNNRITVCYKCFVRFLSREENKRLNSAIYIPEFIFENLQNEIY